MKKIILFLLFPVFICAEWVISPLDASFYGAGNYFLISDTNKTIGYRSGNPCVASQSGSSWTVTTLDSAPASHTLEALSFKPGKNSNIHAVYEYYGSNTELRYSKSSGSSWTSESIEAGLNDPYTLDMFIDSNDVPHIVYYDSGNIYYRNRVGGTWSAAEVVTSAYASYNYIMVNSSGVYVVYGDVSMYYTVKTGGSWSAPTLIAGNVKTTFSFTKTPLYGASNGTVFACAYQTGVTEDLHCVVFNGTTWVDHPVDVGEEKVGNYISTTVNSLGHISVAYTDFSFDNLKVAKYNGATWNVQTIDTAGVVGDQVSICSSSGGQAHMVYEDTTNSTLKYAYWAGTVLPPTVIPTTPPKVSLYNNCFKPKSGEKVSIECEIYQENQLKIELYNLKGSLVASVYEGTKPEGKYTFQWDAVNNTGQTVGSGMYILLIRANNNKVSKKVLVVK